MTTYKVADGEQVDRLYLQNGQTLAKWTGSTLTYLHTDHLGTPIRGTHGLGSGHTPGDEVFQDFFTPYGLRAMPGWNGSTHSGFIPATGPGSNCGVTGFTTHANDCELGQTYMQARSYDPVISRMLSIDPVTFMETNDPRFFNRYAYSFNDPVNLIDPDGRKPDHIMDRQMEGVRKTGRVMGIFSKKHREAKAYNTTRAGDPTVIGGDKFKHCEANCLSAAQEGPEGAEIAKTLSDAKEVFDVATGRNDATESAADHGANEAGLEFGSGGDAGVCSASCESYVQDNVNSDFSAEPPELPEPDLDERN